MSTISLTDFISGVKEGNRYFFDLLGVPESNFEQAGFVDLMANTDDVLAGVNRVLIGYRNNYFNIFPHCLVKYHDNGDVKFIFYGTIQEFVLLFSTAKALFDGLGPGISHEDKGIPFTNTTKLVMLSQGVFSGEEDGLLQLWLYEDTTWLLQYKVIPLHEFSLMVTIRAPKTYDYGIRRKGTILDLIDFDIQTIFRQEEIAREENKKEDELVSIDYTFTLFDPPFAAFDRVRIRKFDAYRQFDKNVQTLVTFNASHPLPYDRKVFILEELIRLYGRDGGGSGELELYEWDILERNEFFVGRNWQFNQFHALYDADKPGEQYSYLVEVDDFQDEMGFKVAIFGYNELISLFAAEE